MVKDNPDLPIPPPPLRKTQSSWWAEGVEAMRPKAPSQEYLDHKEDMARIADLKEMIATSTDLDLNEMMQRSLNLLIETVFEKVYLRHSNQEK